MAIEGSSQSIEPQWSDDLLEATSVERIDETELPPAVRSLARLYEREVGDRTLYVWKWLYAMFPQFRLSCVPSDDGERVRQLKVLLTMYITLLDDIAEKSGDRQTFEAVRRLPYDESARRECLDSGIPEASVAAWAWSTVHALLSTAPRYEEFREQFHFDLRQAINAMDYSLLVNDQPRRLCLAETDLYGPHNMAIYSYVDVDLMHSPGFDSAELGPLREATCAAQRMARIGNWVTTWEREITEGDFSSGVVVSALREDVVTVAELRAPETREAAVERIREEGIEDRYMREWEAIYEELRRQSPGTSTVNLSQFADGMRTVMAFQQESRGHK